MVDRDAKDQLIRAGTVGEQHAAKGVPQISCRSSQPQIIIAGPAHTQHHSPDIPIHSTDDDGELSDSSRYSSHKDSRGRFASRTFQSSAQYQLSHSTSDISAETQ